MKKLVLSVVSTATALLAQLPAQEALHLPIGNGATQIQIAPRLDLTHFSFQGSPPGFLHPDLGDETLFAPRLSLPVDLFFGDTIQAFVLARADTGFDPGFEDLDFRIDEVFVRYSPLQRGIHIQAGKSATNFGNWTRRHDSDEDAFLTAPLLYNELTSVVDGKLFSGAAQPLANARQFNNVEAWLPVIWGPAYVPGISFFGEADSFSLSLEVKSRANSSRPSEWERYDFDDPSYGGRVGFRPSPAWDFGLSFNQGPYLSEIVGAQSGDFNQTTAGFDLSYARGPWQLWAEVAHSTFDLPNVDEDAEVVAYYLESRYKLSAQTYGALRWNQMLFGGLAGGDWDNDLFRVDAALGHRFSPFFEVKGQYSWTHQDADFQNGEHLLGIQFTARFR